MEEGETKGKINERRDRSEDEKEWGKRDHYRRGEKGIGKGK